MIPICTISLRFFSPPEKPTFTRALHHVHVEAERVRLLAREAQEIARRKLRLAARAALGVERGAQELDVGDAGNLDRILEAEEHALRGALVRLQGEQILAVERDRALGHLIAGPPGEHIGRASTCPTRSAP